MKRARWHLALAAQALRNAPCERVAFLWQRDCKDRADLSRGLWCLRCRQLVRLEAMGFVQPERPSDREFREAMERGEVFEIVDGDTGENFAARVQEARRIRATGDQTEAIAYLLDRSVEDVRRVGPSDGGGA